MTRKHNELLQDKDLGINIYRSLRWKSSRQKRYIKRRKFWKRYEFKRLRTKQKEWIRNLINKEKQNG